MNCTKRFPRVADRMLFNMCFKDIYTGCQTDSVAKEGIYITRAPGITFNNDMLFIHKKSLTMKKIWIDRIIIYGHSRLCSRNGI